MLKKWAFFSINFSVFFPQDKKNNQNISEIGIFQPGSTFFADPDPNRPKTCGSDGILYTRISKDGVYEQKKLLISFGSGLGSSTKIMYLNNKLDESIRKPIT